MITLTLPTRLLIFWLWSCCPSRTTLHEQDNDLGNLLNNNAEQEQGWLQWEHVVQNNWLPDLNQDENEVMMQLNAEILENVPQQAPHAQIEEQVEFIPIGMSEPESSSYQSSCSWI
jgi:hypothetical protein